MTAKNILAAVAIKRDDGKDFAYVLPLPIGGDILYAINRAQRQGAQVIHTCRSLNDARAVVADWNCTYMRNGTYITDNMPWWIAADENG